MGLVWCLYVSPLPSLLVICMITLLFCTYICIFIDTLSIRCEYLYTVPSKVHVALFVCKRCNSEYRLRSIFRTCGGWYDIFGLSQSFEKENIFQLKSWNIKTGMFHGKKCSGGSPLPTFFQIRQIALSKKNDFPWGCFWTLKPSSGDHVHFYRYIPWWKMFRSLNFTRILQLDSDPRGPLLYNFANFFIY